MGLTTLRHGSDGIRQDSVMYSDLAGPEKGQHHYSTSHHLDVGTVRYADSCAPPPDVDRQLIKGRNRHSGVKRAYSTEDAWLSAAKIDDGISGERFSRLASIRHRWPDDGEIQRDDARSSQRDYRRATRRDFEDNKEVRRVDEDVKVRCDDDYQRMRQFDYSSYTDVDAGRSHDGFAVTDRDARSVRGIDNRRASDKKKAYVRIDDEIEVRDAMGRSYYDRMPVTDDEDEYVTSEEGDFDVDAVSTEDMKRPVADAYVQSRARSGSEDAQTSRHVDIAPSTAPRRDVLSHREKDLRDRRIVSRLIGSSSPSASDAHGLHDKYSRGSRGRPTHATNKEERHRTTVRHNGKDARFAHVTDAVAEAPATTTVMTILIIQQIDIEERTSRSDIHVLLTAVTMTNRTRTTGDVIVIVIEGHLKVITGTASRQEMCTA